MDKELINLLKNEIEIKSGNKIVRGKDCSILSGKIYEETGQRISTSTLKRFFGIVTSDFSASKYTLELLTQFVGYSGVEDFTSSFSESGTVAPIENSWATLKKRVQTINDKSLQSMKQRTNYEPDKLLMRDFATEKFGDFLISDKSALLFSAPYGLGKTTTLIQLAEHFFINDGQKQNDDILIVIDGKIFFNLYSHYPNIELLEHYLNFKLLSSRAYYFFKNPEQRKGRICVFIDDIDDIFNNPVQYYSFVENLMRMIMAFSYDWYKIVITCRPENLGVFDDLTSQNQLFESCWFEPDFKKMNSFDGSVNIPLLSGMEINQILKKHEIPYDFKYLNDKNSELAEMICEPHFLSLFVKEFKRTGDISEFNFISNYLQNNIYSPPFKEEKQKITDRFIVLCNRGKETDSVKKVELLSKSGTSGAYRDLLSLGVFQEFVKSDNLLTNNTLVKFRNRLIFEFLLMEKWCQGREMNIELFNAIRNYYKENVSLKNNMIQLFFKFLLHYNKTEVLKKLRLISAFNRAN